MLADRNVAGGHIYICCIESGHIVYLWKALFENYFVAFKRAVLTRPPAVRPLVAHYIHPFIPVSKTLIVDFIDQTT